MQCRCSLLAHHLQLAAVIIHWPMGCLLLFETCELRDIAIWERGLGALRCVSEKTSGRNRVACKIRGLWRGGERNRTAFIASYCWLEAAHCFASCGIGSTCIHLSPIPFSDRLFHKFACVKTASRYSSRSGAVPHTRHMQNTHASADAAACMHKACTHQRWSLSSQQVIILGAHGCQLTRCSGPAPLAFLETLPARSNHVCEACKYIVEALLQALRARPRKSFEGAVRLVFVLKCCC